MSQGSCSLQCCANDNLSFLSFVVQYQQTGLPGRLAGKGALRERRKDFALYCSRYLGPSLSFSLTARRSLTSLPLPLVDVNFDDACTYNGCGTFYRLLFPRLRCSAGSAWTAGHCSGAPACDSPDAFTVLCLDVALYAADVTG